MLVKIIYTEKTSEKTDSLGNVYRKHIGEEMVQCKQFQLFVTKIEELEQVELEFDTADLGADRIMRLPLGADSKRYDIYVMNDSGKTVEHYSY